MATEMKHTSQYEAFHSKRRTCLLACDTQNLPSEGAPRLAARQGYNPEVLIALKLEG